MTGGHRVADARDELDAWVLSAAGPAVAYARSLLRNPHDAEDVVQDCFCRLLKRADVYDLPRDGTKLLMRAVTNACINLRTRRRGWLRLVRAADDGTEAADDPPDPRAGAPERALEGAELAERLAAGLESLPAAQRAAVQLRALGHSQAEVAGILEVTPSNAGVLIHRARKALEAFLAPYLAGEAARE